MVHGRIPIGNPVDGNIHQVGGRQMSPELLFRYCFEATLAIGLAIILVIFILGCIGGFDK